MEVDSLLWTAKWSLQELQSAPAGLAFSDGMKSEVLKL